MLALLLLYSHCAIKSKGFGGKVLRVLLKKIFPRQHCLCRDHRSSESFGTDTIDIVDENS